MESFGGSDVSSGIFSFDYIMMDIIHKRELAATLKPKWNVKIIVNLNGGRRRRGFNVLYV